MKKLTAIFFLFIISIQCLPVKELGKCLFDNSFVEEELCKKGIDKKEGADNEKEFFTLSFSSSSAQLAEKVVFSLSADRLLPAPVTDVTTPPPNA